MVTVVVVVEEDTEVAVAASVTSATDLDILPESVGRKRTGATSVMVTMSDSDSGMWHDRANGMAGGKGSTVARALPDHNIWN